MRSLSDSPLVTLTTNVVDGHLASQMIEIARPQLVVGLMTGDTEGSPSRGRMCDVSHFPHDVSPTVRAIVEAMTSATHLEARLAERLQVIRYTVGGEYRAHYDSYDPGSESGRRSMSRLGQCTHTALLYLNGEFSGGATVFPELSLRVRPTAGSVLMFENCRPGSMFRDSRSLHAGTLVEAGEKWVAALWFH